LPHSNQNSDRVSRLVLIVEDNIFVALDLEQALKCEGYCVLGPAFTVHAALVLLEHRNPDVAVLDFDLNGNKVTPVATHLRNRGVPFVLTSGNSEAFEDEVLATVLNLGKPTDRVALLNELERLMT
jgi:two-component system, response regulator PdtaR